MTDEIPILFVPSGSQLRSTAYLTAGWLPLVEDLFARLDEAAPGWTLFDLGQKFKHLHVSPRLPKDISPEALRAVRALIEDARLQSLVTCDWCSASVVPYDGGTRTRCEAHRSVGTFPDRDAPVRLVVRDNVDPKEARMQIDTWRVTLNDGREIDVTFGGGHWSVLPVGWQATWPHDGFHGAEDVRFEIGQPLRFVTLIEDGAHGDGDVVVLADVEAVN